MGGKMRSHPRHKDEACVGQLLLLWPSGAWGLQTSSQGHPAPEWQQGQPVGRLVMATHYSILSRSEQ